jgi:hypothetical protein
MEPEIVCEAGISAWLEHYSPAAPTSAAPTDAAGLSYCIFRAGEDYFGVPLKLVEEIVPRPRIVEVPASPPFFLGMMPHGEETLPVIDLALCAAPLADPKYCLILRLPSGESTISIAIAADDLIWPAASHSTANPSEARFAPYEAASRFIAGRIFWGNIAAWALDPAQVTNALFASVMH